QSGIIRSGAKLVNAVSNSVVPKITVVVGGSFGAGNYALCGKAYDPRFIIAWPNARYAVMGAAQASDTVFSVLKKAREKDKKASHEELEELRLKVKANYEEQTDIRYGAARGWIDAIIQPHQTREALTRLLTYVSRPTPGRIETATAGVVRRHDFLARSSSSGVHMYAHFNSAALAQNKFHYSPNEVCVGDSGRVSDRDRRDTHAADEFCDVGDLCFAP